MHTIEVKRYFVKRDKREKVIIRDERDIYFAPRKETFVLVSKLRKNGNPNEIHIDSFIGRAIMDRQVGEEVEVNMGGLSISDIVHGAVSGNIFVFQVVSIQD